MESDYPRSESMDVKVKLLLNGGHEYILWLKSDSPLLESLLKVLVNRSQNQASAILFQIPVDEGHSALCFPSDHLIGVVTEPPIFVQQKTPTPTPPEVPPARPVASNFLPSECVQLDNFILPAEQEKLLQFVFQK